MKSEGIFYSLASRLGINGRAALRVGPFGDQICSNQQSKYYEACRLGQIYSGANQAGQVTTVGFATAYTGLCLSNPLASGFDLVVGDVAAVFPVVPPASLVVGLMVGYHAATNVAHTAPGTPRSGLFGVGAAGVGLIDTSCTLPIAPVLDRPFAVLGTAALTAVDALPAIGFDYDGRLILPPGAFAAVYTSAASGAAGMLASMRWAEVAR